MKKRLTYILGLLIFAIACYADNVSFTASAPNTVANGQTFQVVYTVNAKGKDLRVPEFKGFDVVAGPFTSTSTSMQVINGNVSTETTLRYTYTLLPTAEGSFNIAAATIVVDGTQHQSNALTIKVIPAESEPSSAQQRSNNGGQQQVQPSQQITNENLFVRPIVSRTSVYEQEAILLTYKIYTKVDLLNVVDWKFPDLQGFMVQDIDISQDKQYGLENYEGRNYNTIIARQYLIYPQHAGSIDIDQLSCTAIVRVRNQRQVRSIFDDFFDSYQEVKKTLTAPAVKINVKSLPSPKPVDFCNGIGNFSVKTSINAEEVNANEAITLSVKISGTGNMKMLKNPEIKFPADFEVYEPKVNNDFKSSTSGVSGTKTIEYLAIPRHSGDYEIPETTFSYFDTESHEYKTLTIPAYKLKVNKGNATENSVSNYTNQEQVRMLASDIRYINTNKFEIKPMTDFFAGTAAFALCYLLPFALALMALLFFRKQAKQNANIALVRNKKANKVARKRLKIAEKYLRESNKKAFYEEVLKALWGYLGDKLSLPLSDLNKENVASKLAVHQVDTNVSEEFLQLLDECEFARYAPATDEHAAMDHTYERTLNLIAKLEDQIKH